MENAWQRCAKDKFGWSGYAEVALLDISAVVCKVGAADQYFQLQQYGCHHCKARQEERRRQEEQRRQEERRRQEEQRIQTLRDAQERYPRGDSVVNYWLGKDIIVTVALQSKAVPFGDAMSDLISGMLKTIEGSGKNDNQVKIVQRRLQGLLVDLEPVLCGNCRPGRAFQHMIDVSSSLQQHVVKWSGKSYMKRAFNSSKYKELFERDMIDLDRCIPLLTAMKVDADHGFANMDNTGLEDTRQEVEEEGVQRRQEENEELQEQQVEEVEGGRRQQEQHVRRNRTEQPEQATWEPEGVRTVKFESFSNKQQIGSGSFKLVYKARWTHSRGDTDVAVLQIKGSGKIGQEDFLRELQIFQLLGLHLNLLRLFSVTFEPQSSDWCLVTEFASMGSLDSWLLDAHESGKTL
eukprot:36918-Hanusia_phi.AAC.1